MISNDLSTPSRSVGFAHEKNNTIYRPTRKPSHRFRGQSPRYNPRQVSQRPTHSPAEFTCQGSFLY
ncbi:hypothetical protein NEISICOT_03533 [Neisseria sicca ATCC 29256]|uniref:Uncharacterized protein n=1 Tax=Neisseria sicca ATCC 29256 TaxID=547045 RepID=C6MAF1_NEISI|nr:hypothetical protein NEISICOT_03533 [Neisseria sicca ATCC 29256]